MTAPPAAPAPSEVEGLLPCAPPDGTLCGTWHWLLQSSGHKAAAWWGGERWAYPGRDGHIHHISMAHLGYTYLGPVAPYDASPTGEVTVSVKPLEWRDHSFGMAPLWVAFHSWGSWTIEHDNVSDWPWVLRPFVPAGSNFQTLEAAKRAAEEEHANKCAGLFAAQPSGDDRSVSDVEAPGLERAAKWHEEQAQIERGKQKAIPGGTAFLLRAIYHERDATAIRALPLAPGAGP